MRYIRQSNNQRVIVPEAAPIGVGGEARVFAASSDGRLAAKIYHQATDTQARKLAAMLANPPDDPMSSQEHISIAWPLDLLHKMYGDQGFAGFLMPRVSNMRPLFNVYNPSTRRQELPLFNYLYLHRAARNVSSAVRALHNRGYVIGDINESNLLVTETALVTLVDTDSFQVRDEKTGTVYRCPVGKPEFTPPEHQGKNFRQITRAETSDRFGLAVLIFQLLMEGAHPFSGVYQGDEDPPPYETRIQNGHYTYGTRPTPFKPMPLAPPITILAPHLRALFLRCFEEGHAAPDLRPDAAIWANALMQAEDALITCPRNAQHRYGNHLSACPWCERTEKLGGRDPFPLQTSTPYVRPGRDIRRVEPQPVHYVPGHVRAASTAPGHTPIVVRLSSQTPNIQHPIPLLPNWPLAPSVHPSTTGNPGNVTWPAIPNYPAATWTALSFVLLALMVPGFHLFFAVCTLVAACIGWFSGRAGRWMAGISGVVGAIVALVVLAGAANRSLVLSDLRAIEEKGPVRSVAFSPDSRTVAVGTERNEDQRLINGEAALFDVQTGDITHRFLQNIGPSNIASVAFSSDGRFFAAGTSAVLEPGSVKLWDTRTWRLRRVLTGFKSDVESVAFSPDSARLVTGSRDRIVEIWDVATGAAMRILDAPGEVFAVAVSPDGTLIAAGSGSAGSGEPGRISVWDAHTGTLLWSKKGHSDRCTSVVFAPNGGMLGSAGNDNTIRLWNPRTGSLSKMLEAVGVLTVNSMAFSPDGQKAACGGSDGSARLWDIAKGSVLHTFPGSDATVETIAFAPDGKMLACGDRNGVVNLWRIHEN